jgi:hypothetical protein
MDWTSRFLEGGCKVFAFHTIDLETHALHQTISADKSLQTVIHHAMQSWQALGLPDGLQMDNDAAFCGGYKVARVFGYFVRLCLYFGIEPIFIPPHSPERNAVVERLNGLWSQGFWRRRRFASFGVVCRASSQFEQWYRQEYEPPTLGGKTPAQAQQGVKRERLSRRQIGSLPEELPITAGRLHFLRQVDAEGKIWVLNEKWKVDRRLAGKYVWAVIITHEQRLEVYYRRSSADRVRLVKTFHYEIAERVAALLPEFKRRNRRRKMFTML